jgi:hypothetical protein
VIYASEKGCCLGKRKVWPSIHCPLLQGYSTHLGIGTAFFILYAGMLGFEPDSGAAEILRVVVLTVPSLVWVCC